MPWDECLTVGGWCVFPLENVDFYDMCNESYVNEQKRMGDGHVRQNLNWKRRRHGMSMADEHRDGREKDYCPEKQSI